MRNEVNILRFLGLAARAGKVTSGYDQVEAAIRNGNVKLLILSADISKNTLSRLLDMGSRENIDLPDAYSFGTKASLGQAIGKPDRAIVAVTDTGFADKLSEMLSLED
ncbi:MAG: ribosomal L7Ae/L30e/S12e/Gadd45 family protein [Clostridiales bacterium]|nr:ribosomal L7Ae/L30e/S12e/Gadd45 family protein [Clostridiales bacterium]